MPLPAFFHFLEFLTALSLSLRSDEKQERRERVYSARVSVLENLWFAALFHAEHEEGGYHSERAFKDSEEILLGGRWKNETGGCNEMGHIWREIQASCCARLISYLFVRIIFPVGDH